MVEGHIKLEEEYVYEVARKACEEYEGNLIEIGLGYGSTTLKLLELAEEFNRIVIGVDPFEDGWDKMQKGFGEPYPYEMFVCKDHPRLKLIKKDSFSLEVWKEVKTDKLCFAHVDGDQSSRARVSYDIELVNHSAIICVDDYINRSDVRNAVRNFTSGELTRIGRRHIVFNGR